MFEILGWLVCGLGMCWLSLFVFFTTVSTFGEGLFAKALHYKALGVVMWCALFYGWYEWLSVININVGG